LSKEDKEKNKRKLTNQLKIELDLQK